MKKIHLSLSQKLFYGLFIVSTLYIFQIISSPIRTPVTNTPAPSPTPAPLQLISTDPKPGEQVWFLPTEAISFTFNRPIPFENISYTISPSVVTESYIYTDGVSFRIFPPQGWKYNIPYIVKVTAQSQTFELSFQFIKPRKFDVPIGVSSGGGKPISPTQKP